MNMTINNTNQNDLYYLLSYSLLKVNDFVKFYLSNEIILYNRTDTFV